MPSIPIIHVSKLIRILTKAGYTIDKSKGKGSHVKLYGHDGTSIVIPKTLDSPGVRRTITKFLTKQGTDIDKLFK